MATIRVYLADDHPIVRDGIRKLLESSVGIEVIGEAEDGVTAYVEVIEKMPDVLLLDRELPGIHGVDLTKIHVE